MKTQLRGSLAVKNRDEAVARLLAVFSANPYVEIRRMESPAGSMYVHAALLGQYAKPVVVTMRIANHTSNRPQVSPWYWDLRFNDRKLLPKVEKACKTLFKVDFKSLQALWIKHSQGVGDMSQTETEALYKSFSALVKTLYKLP